MRRTAKRLLPFAFVGVFVGGGDTPWYFLLPVAGAFVGLAFWLSGSFAREEDAPALPDGEPDRLRERLLEWGRADVAAELDRGREELAALRAWRDTVGDLDAQAAEARAESERLRERAAAATDADTAATWAQGAELADRRVGRLQELRSDWERASARIEAFEQLIKMLRVDLLERAARPVDLDGRLGPLAQEVAALSRARAEVRRLEAAGAGGS